MSYNLIVWCLSDNTCTLYVQELISLSYYVSAMVQIWVQTNLQHSQVQPLRHMYSHYLPDSNSFICGASHREAIIIIFSLWYESASGGLEP